MIEENVKMEAISVEVKSLSKIFLAPTRKEKDFTAVNNVSMKIKAGELVTLLGPSGCGKTTILRMLSGFTIPTNGQILFGGKDVTDTPPHQRDVGMMFQSYAIFPHMSVFENIAYGLRVKKVQTMELKKRVKNVLSLMQIEELMDRIPEQLSGGQQQRVALARAIVTEPKILLFDEPLSNLDANMREYMRDELRALQQRLGITSIYVTHDQMEAMAISDSVVVMNEGKIAQVGDSHDIYTNPVNQFVANFMGKANFITTTVKAVNSEFVTINIAGQELNVLPNSSLRLTTGDKVSCMIRPEFLVIDNNGRFNAHVVQASYLGSVVEYKLDVGGERLLMTDHNLKENGIIEKGETINISINEELLRLLAP